jgi:hypothetical protein
MYCLFSRQPSIDISCISANVVLCGSCGDDKEVLLKIGLRKKSTTMKMVMKKRRTYLADVAPTIGGEPFPGRRHRMDNKPVKWDINHGFIVCWIGILILQGAHLGSEKRTARKMWLEPPYGLSIPYVRNSMQ